MPEYRQTLQRVCHVTANHAEKGASQSVYSAIEANVEVDGSVIVAGNIDNIQKDMPAPMKFGVVLIRSMTTVPQREAAL